VGRRVVPDGSHAPVPRAMAAAGDGRGPTADPDRTVDPARRSDPAVASQPRLGRPGPPEGDRTVERPAGSPMASFRASRGTAPAAGRSHRLWASHRADRGTSGSALPVDRRWGVRRPSRGTDVPTGAARRRRGTRTPAGPDGRGVRRPDGPLPDPPSGPWVPARRTAAATGRAARSTRLVDRTLHPGSGCPGCGPSGQAGVRRRAGAGSRRRDRGAASAGQPRVVSSWRRQR